MFIIVLKIYNLNRNCKIGLERSTWNNKNTPRFMTWTWALQCPFTRLGFITLNRPRSCFPWAKQQKNKQICHGQKKNDLADRHKQITWRAEMGKGWHPAEGWLGSWGRFERVALFHGAYCHEGGKRILSSREQKGQKEHNSLKEFRRIVLFQSGKTYKNCADLEFHLKKGKATFILQRALSLEIYGNNLKEHQGQDQGPIS